MENLVFRGDNNQVVTTSLKVAEVFQKEHRRVLQDIRELACSENFRLHNFVQSSYTNAQNKKMPMFIITKDGFALLVMGYTGEKAMAFKEAYINAFNEMERALRETQPKLPTTYKEALQQLLVQVEENERLLLENKQQQQQIIEFEPKATYYDLVLQTPDLMTVSQIAKDYGKSAVWLNKQLHELGIQYQQSGVWLLYQKYAALGFTKSKTNTYFDDDGNQHSKLHTYWTQKGRLFIYDILKQHNVLPLIEKQ